MKKILLFAVLLLLPTHVRAHVGSPDIFLEGNAGPYRLFVTVRMPEAIPGVAEVEIRSESGNITAIGLLPLRLTGAGSEYAPKPELLERSANDPPARALWCKKQTSATMCIEFLSRWAILPTA